VSKRYRALTFALLNSSFNRSPKHRRFIAFLEIVFVPNIASAKKNMRKTRAATVRNRAQRAALRTAVKKAAAPGATAAAKLAAVRLIDRAARKGLIHRNTAARRKSAIARTA
jgi:small subunit ribosomal protein S20